MRRARAAGIATLVFELLATPAFADITAFIGATTTPANRSVRGVAAGAGLLMIGFEFEYAVTTEDPSVAAPSLKTGMGNVLIQTPVPIMGVQPYLTGGAGLYHEELAANGHTNFGLNTGGGVKIALAGPLRLRVDYRMFRLGSSALYSPVHRVYAGLNLKF